MSANGHGILIVDDDDDLLEMMELVLSGAGYPTRTALNGEQALAEVEKEKPALILLDMVMPVMDGWRFADELHARHGNGVPIVVVTAAEHARQRCDTVGAADVLAKPFDISDLLRTVARHVPAP